MGVSKRFSDFKYSYVPGPGMYKIKGFAEEVTKKAEKTSKFKEKNQFKETKYENKSVLLNQGENMEVFEDEKIDYNPTPINDTSPLD